MTADERRARRTNVHTAGAIVMLGFLGWIIHKIPADDLQLIAMGLVVILTFREVFHGAENVTARIKAGLGRDGASMEVSPHSETSA